VVPMRQVWRDGICKGDNMEQKPSVDTESQGAEVRREGVRRDCGCASKQTQPAGGASVAVPGTPTRTDPVSLTERELLIYQAGQSFGAAQALRQAAEAVNKLAHTLNAQAAKQQEVGNQLLDQALGKGPNPKRPPLCQRVLKAVNALAGAED
jgi:hypothetical protein